jgi:hypothetical protein
MSLSGRGFPNATLQIHYSANNPTASILQHSTIPQAQRIIDGNSFGTAFQSMTSHRPPTIPHPMLSQLTKVTKHSTPAFQIELPASATILLEMNFCQGLHLVEEAPVIGLLRSRGLLQRNFDYLHASRTSKITSMRVDFSVSCIFMWFLTVRVIARPL